MPRSHMAWKHASGSERQKVALWTKRGWFKGCNLKELLASRRRRKSRKPGGVNWGLLRHETAELHT